MKRLLAATAVLSLLAAGGPALAATPKNAPCKAPKNATVITAGAAAVESTPTTPVGAANEGTEPAGSFVLDLRGKPEGVAGKLTFTLSWDNPASDYDLIVGGANELGTDNPEVVSFKARHCKVVPVEIGVFLGVPVDALTLAVKGS